MITQHLDTIDTLAPNCEPTLCGQEQPYNSRKNPQPTTPCEDCAEYAKVMTLARDTATDASTEHGLSLSGWQVFTFHPKMALLVIIDEPAIDPIKTALFDNTAITVMEERPHMHGGKEFIIATATDGRVLAPLAPRRIHTRDELCDLAGELGVRPDWHENDEADVTASVDGVRFNNAGHWPAEATNGTGTTMVVAGTPEPRPVAEVTEMYVTIRKDGLPVAQVNLATLMAWATGADTDD